MSTLYLVATPIGNLEDISARALRVLKDVSLIAAEDTRHTGKLLNHFGIHTPVISYHEHNKLTRLERVLEALAQGDVALVSDAGTPALNDPGYELVRAVIEAGYSVSPIPGASAPVAALAASGLPSDTFLYLGYLPRKPTERRRLLEQVALLRHTLVFLETPHRLISSLGDLLDILGDRQAAVARELTKLHEEIFRGSLSQALQHFKSSPPRGEFTLVLAGCPQEASRWPVEHLQNELNLRLQAGEAPSQIARGVANEAGWSKKDVYALLTQIRRSKKEEML